MARNRVPEKLVGRVVGYTPPRRIVVHVEHLPQEYKHFEWHTLEPRHYGNARLGNLVELQYRSTRSEGAWVVTRVLQD